jgi:hypothetical protein
MDTLAAADVLLDRLYATGRGPARRRGHLTLISAGLNSVTMIAGFVVFDAERFAAMHECEQQIAP